MPRRNGNARYRTTSKYDGAFLAPRISFRDADCHPKTPESHPADSQGPEAPGSDSDDPTTRSEGGRDG